MMFTLSAVLFGSALFAADYPLKTWESSDPEGVISNLQENNFLYTVSSDHKKSGSKYVPAVGWIRARNIPNGRVGVDMNKYNQIEFDLTISEGLEGVQFPIACGLACLSGKKDEIRFYQEFESGKSYKIVIPVKEMKRLDAASLKSVQSIQFVFYEKRLPDTSVYKFQFNNLRLTTGTASAIQVEEKE